MLRSSSTIRIVFIPARIRCTRVASRPPCKRRVSGRRGHAPGRPMFATIVGPYPRPDGLDDEAALRLAIEDQLLADMGVLADGAATPDPDALAAWRRADAMARSLA